MCCGVLLAAFNANHRNGVCHKTGSEGLRSLSWNVTALVLGLVFSTTVWWKRPCCFNWVEVFEMNSSKILNNHITHACNCTSAYKPMRPYYPGNHSSPAAVHESSFAQKWKKTTNKWILRRSQAHASKSPQNLFLCDLITVIVGWVSGGHSRGELLFIQIHRSNQKWNTEHLAIKNGTDKSQKEKYKCVNGRPLQEKVSEQGGRTVSIKKKKKKKQEPNNFHDDVWFC